jgi:serine/threonine protein kinase
MLRTFKQKRHPNLVKLLATFRHEGKYHLLLPYADSNLRQYWQNNPTPNFSSTTVLWVLQQFKSLASGLHTMHEYRLTQESIDSIGSHGARSRTMRSTGSQATREPDDIRRYARHGDIKPENILWFRNEDEASFDCDEGALVIADFGLTDLHRRVTRSHIPVLGTGTPTYEPPEV